MIRVAALSGRTAAPSGPSRPLPTLPPPRGRTAAVFRRVGGPEGGEGRRGGGRGRPVSPSLCPPLTE